MPGSTQGAASPRNPERLPLSRCADAGIGSRPSFTFEVGARLLWTLSKATSHGLAAITYARVGVESTAAGHARSAAAWYRRYLTLKEVVGA